MNESAIQFHMKYFGQDVKEKDKRCKIINKHNVYQMALLEGIGFKIIYLHLFLTRG